MRRAASLFGAGLTVFFVMFSAAPVVRPARAADLPPAVNPADASATPAARAKLHYQQGEAYFKSKRFSDAIDEYQKGYLEKANPVFIFNIAQCHRLLGHPAAAVEFYQRYLKEAPDGPGRPVAEKQIAELSAPPAGAPAVAAETAPAVVVPLPAAPVAAPAIPPAAPPPAPPVAEAAPAAPAAEVVPPPPLPTAPAPVTGGPNAPVFVSTQAQPTEKPVYTRWWFWTAIAAVVVGTVIVAAATSSNRPDCDTGRVCK